MRRKGGGRPPYIDLPRKCQENLSAKFQVGVEYYGRERGVVYGSGLDIIPCDQKIKLSCHSIAYQIRIATAGESSTGMHSRYHIIY